MTWKEGTKRALQRFFEISPLHGASYIGFRAFLYEGFIWGIAMIICLGFMIRDVNQLTAQYVAEQTAVSILVQRNHTLFFPDAAICFDIVRASLSASISNIFNETAFNDTLAAFSKSIIVTPDLSLLSERDPGIDLILKTTYILLAQVVDYDIGVPGGGGPVDANTERAIELMDAFYKKSGYNYGELMQQTAR